VRKPTRVGPMVDGLRKAVPSGRTEWECLNEDGNRSNFLSSNISKKNATMDKV
jgi:hypothetical protein